MTKRRTKWLSIAIAALMAAVCVGALSFSARAESAGLRLVYAEDFENAVTMKTDTAFWDYDWNLNAEHSAIITPASKWDNYTTPLSGLQSYRFVSNNNEYERRDNYVEFADISPNEIPLSPHRDYVIGFKARTNNLKQLKVSFPNLGVGTKYDFAFDPCSYTPTEENFQQTGDYYIKPMNMTGDGANMSIVYFRLNAETIPSYGAIALFSGKKVNADADCCFDIDDFRVYEGRLNVQRDATLLKSNGGAEIRYDFETEQNFNTDGFVFDDRGSPTAIEEGVQGFSSKVLKVTEPANSGERALINMNESLFSMRAGKTYCVEFTYKTENVDKIKIEAFGLSGGGKSVQFDAESHAFAVNDWARLAPKISFAALGAGVTKFSYEMEKVSDGGNPFLMVVFPKVSTADAHVWIDDFSVTEITENNLPQEPDKVFYESYEGKELKDIVAVRKNSPISVWEPGDTVTTAHTTKQSGLVISGDTSMAIEVDGNNGDIPLFDITPSAVVGFRPGFVPSKEYTFSFKYRAENVNLIKFEFDRTIIDSGNLEYLPSDVTKQTAYGSFDDDKWRCRDLGGGVYELAFSFTALSSKVDRPFLFCMHRTSGVKSVLVLDDVRITSGGLDDFNRLFHTKVYESADFESLTGVQGMEGFVSSVRDGKLESQIVYDDTVINGAYSVSVAQNGELSYQTTLLKDNDYTVKFKYAAAATFALALNGQDAAVFDGSGLVSGAGVKNSRIVKEDGFVNVALALDTQSENAKLTFKNGAGTLVLDDFFLMTDGDNSLKETVVRRAVSQTERVFDSCDFDGSNASNKFLLNRQIYFPFLPTQKVADISQTYTNGETINGVSSLKMRVTNDKAGIETYPAVLKVDGGAGGRCMTSGTLYTVKFRYSILSDEESTVTQNSKFFAFAKQESAPLPYNVLAFNADGTIDFSDKGGLAGYDNIVSAQIVADGEKAYAVRMTFRTQNVQPFGLNHFGFGMVGGGTFIVDDFALYQGHNDDVLTPSSAQELPQASFQTGNDFENGLGNFYAWQDNLLTDGYASKLTAQKGKVINGGHSLYVNRNPRAESDANLWSGFLRSKEDTVRLKTDTLYTVQLRYKILSDVTGGGWFYVMLKADGNDRCDSFFGFDADGVNYEYQRNVAYYDIRQSGDTYVLTVALRTAKQDGLVYKGLEMGSYRGGEIAVDDVLLYEGAYTAQPELPELTAAQKPVHVAENGFETENKNWSTVGDVVEDGIRGKSLRLQSEISNEVMLTYNKALAPNTRYSVFFRYKPLTDAPYDGKGNFLLGVKTGFEAKDYKFYQSFSKDGKPLYYNYDGSFSGYQIYDLTITPNGEFFDASFTVITGASNDYRLYFGIYGCGAMLLDDVSVNLGQGVSVPGSGDRIVLIASPETINVESGAAVALPETVELLLNDGSKTDAPVLWEALPDLSVAGTYEIKGSVDCCDYILTQGQDGGVSVTVNVTPRDSVNETPKKLSAGQIAGITVGSVLGAALVGVGAFLLIRLLKKKKA